VIVLTDAELELYAAQVETRLAELQDLEFADPVRGGKKDAKRAEVEKNLGDFAEFWERFIKAAKQELCDKQGSLYKHWQSWGGKPKPKQTLEAVQTVLMGMGIGLSLELAALIAVIVEISAVILKIGIKAVCL